MASRKQFLRDMIGLGFLHPDQAPTLDAQKAFPTDVPLASSESRSKLVVIFHDESIFNANDEQMQQWGMKGEGMLRPKSKGSGIMASDFIEERAGYLALTNEEYKRAKSRDETISQFVKAERDTGPMKQLKKAVKSNIPKQMGGILFGYSIIQVAILPWLKMRWMLLA